jgi:hypothetical protein
MKKKLTYLAVIIVVITSACNPEQKNWNNARSQNTIESYEQFLVKYPIGSLSDSANFFIEKIYFNQAKKGNTIAAFKKYLNSYPTGSFSDSANLLIHEIYPMERLLGEWTNKYKIQEFSFSQGVFSGSTIIYEDFPPITICKDSLGMLEFKLVRDDYTFYIQKTKEPGSYLLTVEYYKNKKIVDALPLAYSDEDGYSSKGSKDQSASATIRFNKSGQHFWTIKTKGPEFEISFLRNLN